MNKFLKNKIHILIIILSLFLILNNSVILAEEETNELRNLGDSPKIMKDVAGVIGYETGSKASPEKIIPEIIKIILSFLGIIFLILIIIGGYQWMTAGGNEEVIKKARTRIINAVIGLAIVLLAYAITYFITAFLTEQAIQ